MDSLDVLVSENNLLSHAFACWSGEPTDDATQQGMEAKFIIRHLAIREAAREDVKHAFSSLDDIENLSVFIHSDRRPMREAISEATRMTANVAASELNVGQAFGQVMEHARVTFESDWDDRFDVLFEHARVKNHLRLHSADYIFYRSPARLSPSGPHWYERIGAIRLVHAGYDVLRRSPTVQRSYLPESLQSAERAMFTHLDHPNSTTRQPIASNELRTADQEPNPAPLAGNVSVQSPASSTFSELPEVDMEQANDHGPEVTALLINEHSRMHADMHEVLRESDPLERRRRFQDLARDLIRNETAEKEVIYPILARIDGGSKLRSEALRQEQVIAADLARLLRRVLWHPRGRTTLHRIEEFSRLLDQHHAFEKDSLLPVVIAVEAKTTRQMMGTWIGYAESLAPTRPHPHGPQRLPGLMTSGVALSLIDRLRDRSRRLVSPPRERGRK